MRDPGSSVRALTLFAAILGCSEARAQFGAGAAGGLPPNGAMFGNPYMNPYLNPYLNPYATTQQMSPGNAGLYFFSAQAAMGGIGSGQISGVRPGPRTPGRGEAEAGAKPTEERREVRGVPASAARYFMRGPQRSPSPSFYNRQGRYYSSPKR